MRQIWQLGGWRGGEGLVVGSPLGFGLRPEAPFPAYFCWGTVTLGYSDLGVCAKRARAGAQQTVENVCRDPEGRGRGTWRGRRVSRK